MSFSIKSTLVQNYILLFSLLKGQFFFLDFVKKVFLCLFCWVLCFLSNLLGNNFLKCLTEITCYGSHCLFLVFDCLWKINLFNINRARLLMYFNLYNFLYFLLKSLIVTFVKLIFFTIFTKNSNSKWSIFDLELTLEFSRGPWNISKDLFSFLLKRKILN